MPPVSEIGPTQPNPPPLGGTEKYFLLRKLFTFEMYTMSAVLKRGGIPGGHRNLLGLDTLFFGKPGFLRGQPQAHYM